MPGDFGAVFDAHKDAVWAFLLRQGFDLPRAEDLFQTVFLKALKAFERFREEASVKTWLFAIAANAVLDERRARRTALPIPDALPAEEVEASAGLERDEALDRLKRALDGLPANHRLLFTLVRFEGLPLAEAARAAGLTPGAAKVTLFRVSKRIGACFARETAT